MGLQATGMIKSNQLPSQISKKTKSGKLQFIKYKIYGQNIHTITT